MLIKVADPANVDIRASLAKLPIVQTGKKKQQQQQQQTDKLTPANTNKQKAKIEKQNSKHKQTERREGERQ
jgi:hypothetical protein